MYTQGFLLILPIPMVVGVEQGIVNAITTTLGVLFRLSPFFFVFGTGTNAHYVNAAITQGTAKYQVNVELAHTEPIRYSKLDTLHCSATAVLHRTLIVNAHVPTVMVCFVFADTYICVCIYC
jgi:hypothetical protein